MIDVPFRGSKHTLTLSTYFQGL